MKEEKERAAGDSDGDSLKSSVADGGGGGNSSSLSPPPSHFAAGRQQPPLLTSQVEYIRFYSTSSNMSIKLNDPATFQPLVTQDIWITGIQLASS